MGYISIIFIIYFMLICSISVKTQMAALIITALIETGFALAIGLAFRTKKR